MYAPIKWTMEREQDGKLYVFDIALTRSGNVVQTSVYRKLSASELDENHIENEQIDFSKSLYAPYHPRAKKMCQSLQKSFGINVVYKKTQTLGNLLFKRKPRKDKWETSHVAY